MYHRGRILDELLNGEMGGGVSIELLRLHFEGLQFYTISLMLTRVCESVLCAGGFMNVN